MERAVIGPWGGDRSERVIEGAHLYTTLMLLFSSGLQTM